MLLYSVFCRTAIFKHNYTHCCNNEEQKLYASFTANPDDSVRSGTILLPSRPLRLDFKDLSRW